MTQSPALHLRSVSCSSSSTASVGRLREHDSFTVVRWRYKFLGVVTLRPQHPFDISVSDLGPLH
jgi:hypothetical protein